MRCGVFAIFRVQTYTLSTRTRESPMDNHTVKPTTERPYLKTAELADAIGVHPLTLARWRREGVGPAFVRFGRAVRYPRASISDFAVPGQMAAA